jgi:hypothetical protein
MAKSNADAADEDKRLDSPDNGEEKFAGAGRLVFLRSALYLEGSRNAFHEELQAFDDFPIHGIPIAIVPTADAGWRALTPRNVQARRPFGQAALRRSKNESKRRTLWSVDRRHPRAHAVEISRGPVKPRG